MGLMSNSTNLVSKKGPSLSWTISFSKQDQLAYIVLRFIALIIVLLLGAMIFKLFMASKLAFSEFGFSFIYTDFWNPIEDEFGALPFIFGTLITSFVALLLAAPISIGVAIYVNEYLGTKLSTFLSLFVELIAAVPSIIFGLWGLYYLAPFIKNDLAPFLKSTLGFLPFFQGVSYGIGVLAASIILALMIIPTITTVCREIFKTVPTLNKEAALALGATKYEMIKLAIIRPSFSGIIGAIVLGLGRALGETMAVAMVIGNTPVISSSLFSSASTMASVMANEYAEADSDLHLSALCYVGLLLFVVTFIVNMFARTIVWRQTHKIKRRN